jgi:hypothetical protein
MNEKHALLDFETKDSEKSRYSTALIILFISFIFFLLLDFVFDLDYRFAMKKNIDWNFVFMVLILPTIGAFLFVKQNKFGWAICLFYYELMAILLVTTFLRDFLKKGYNNSDLMDGWRAYLLFFGSIILILMLVSKDIRYYFKITASNFRTTLFISSIIILIVDVMILTT